LKNACLRAQNAAKNRRAKRVQKERLKKALCGRKENAEKTSARKEYRRSSSAEKKRANALR
jgi:hypothetical protein